MLRWLEHGVCHMYNLTAVADDVDATHKCPEWVLSSVQKLVPLNLKSRPSCGFESRLRHGYSCLSVCAVFSCVPVHAT
jgi:hypothetical protein